MATTFALRFRGLETNVTTEAGADAASLIAVLHEHFENGSDATAENILFFMNDQQFNVEHKLEDFSTIFSGATVEARLASGSTESVLQSDEGGGENANEGSSERKSDSRTDEGSLLVRLRGLPYRFVEKDIIDFLPGVNVVSVSVLLDRDQQSSGEAFVRVASEDDVQTVMSFHKKKMGVRYIEVFRLVNLSFIEKVATSGVPVEADQHVPRDSRPSKARSSSHDRTRADRRGSSRESRTAPLPQLEDDAPVIRLRGLPWEAKHNDVREFLLAGGVTVKTIIDVPSLNGKPSGECFVVLESPGHLPEARKLDKKEMGRRYIEVYDASAEDVYRQAARDRERDESRDSRRRSDGSGGRGGSGRDSRLRSNVSGRDHRGESDHSRRGGGGSDRGSGSSQRHAVAGSDLRGPGGGGYDSRQSRGGDFSHGRDGGAGGRGGYESYSDRSQGSYNGDSGGYGDARGSGGVYGHDRGYDDRRGGGGGDFGGRGSAYPEGPSGFRGISSTSPFAYSPSTSSSYPLAPSSIPMSSARGGYDHDGFPGSSRGGGSGGGYPVLEIRPLAPPVTYLGRGGGFDDRGGVATAGRDEPFVLRMRGLPYSAHTEDVRAFFNGCLVDGIDFVIDSSGRPSGDAFVAFRSAADYSDALSRNKRAMGSRYIELFRSSLAELETSRFPGSSSRSAVPPQRNGAGSNYDDRRALPPSVAPPRMRESEMDTCVKMRNMPYGTTDEILINFFREGGVVPLRIHRKETGEQAYVEFATSADTSLALSRDRAFIGSKSVDVFRCSFEEIMEVVGVRPTSLSASYSQGYEGRGQSAPPRDPVYAGDGRGHPSSSRDPYYGRNYN